MVVTDRLEVKDTGCGQSFGSYFICLTCLCYVFVFAFVSMYVYHMYIYIYICVYVYIYIYIYFFFLFLLLFFCVYRIVPVDNSDNALVLQQRTSKPVLVVYKKARDPVPKCSSGRPLAGGVADSFASSRR